MISLVYIGPVWAVPKQDIDIGWGKGISYEKYVKNEHEKWPAEKYRWGGISSGGGRNLCPSATPMKFATLECPRTHGIALESTPEGASMEAEGKVTGLKGPSQKYVRHCSIQVLAEV